MSGSIKVLGYGSLMSAKGVNEHKFESPVKQSDLKPVRIKDYERNWNAKDADGRYLGMSPKKGARANGVVLDVPKEHLHRFLQSEGADSNHGLGIYKVERVTDKVFPKQGADVFTLVTKNPKDEGRVSDGYRMQVAAALEPHTRAFQKEFAATTPKVPAAPAKAPLPDNAHPEVKK